MEQANILVVGAGNFGTCLAHHLGKQGHRVTLWTRDVQQAEAINRTRKNPYYLQNLDLSHNIYATTELNSVVEDVTVCLIAIPTQGLDGFLRQHRTYLSKDLCYVVCSKGIEVATGRFPRHIITDVLRADPTNLFVLSGPSFSDEVAVNQPTAVSLGGLDDEACQRIQGLFHSKLFRTYTSQDPVGVEVAGALKNVIAIAAGASDGLGFRSNSRAALLTRGLAEITRFGVVMGANPLTFNGLSGVGDLFLTCTSTQSRNYRLGYQLGKGNTLQAVLDGMESTAEGVGTTRAAFDLSAKLGIDSPIVNEVYSVLYSQKPIQEAINALLTRNPKPEIQLG